MKKEKSCSCEGAIRSEHAFSLTFKESPSQCNMDFFKYFIWGLSRYFTAHSSLWYSM